MLSIIALANKNRTIICNGYKDSEYIKLALIGQQLGLNVIIVIEKLSELNLITEISSALQIKPNLGIRVRLSSVAAGNWQNTGGEKSKFGLHTAQIITAIEQLESAGFLDCLVLLHFHIGSQVSNLQHFQRALREGARFYAELCKMNVPIVSVNVGGGLGVDYEGTQSPNYCSVDYTLQDYANIVIHAFKDICQEHNLLQPEILSESGRALTAHHAMLITNVIDIEQAPGLQNTKTVNSDDPGILQYLWNILQLTNEDNIEQSYLDASDYYENTKEMFAHGLLDLKHRARVEEIYYSICRRIKSLLTENQYEIKKELNEKLADKYFCNFSLFQSMPDAWAINQIFPIMPLHRLEERPTQRAIIKDITCDSDGRIDLYIDGHGIETTLPLHNSKLDEPYIIGIFLLGAYQEILGDIHNLFGDTASINIEATVDGNIHLTELQQGDTVSDLLNYVHMGATNFKTIYQQKIAASQLSSTEQEEYLNDLVQGLSGYTYLEE